MQKVQEDRLGHMRDQLRHNSILEVVNCLETERKHLHRFNKVPTQTILAAIQQIPEYRKPAISTYRAKDNRSKQVKAALIRQGQTMHGIVTIT